MVPLGPLRQFVAHEQELLAGHSVHITKEQAQVGILLPLVARHHAEEGPFPVDGFIMRERQHEVLVKGIDHPERQFAMMIFSERRIAFEIAQGVVHPAHIPLQTEAETACVGRPRNL